MSSAPTHQPWIRSARYDGVFILLPPFLSLLVVALLPLRFRQSAQMPVIAWCMLVLLVDVAHVYSTLYSTYFNTARMGRQRRLFLLIPILCYVVGIALHWFGALVFWRALAYLAVFHFIRQQYGFMRLYARGQQGSTGAAWLDALVVYSATLYPLVYWHCTPGRNFNWFVPNDFIIAQADTLKTVAVWLYSAILVLYLLKETIVTILTRVFNVPKNLLIAGTVVSWYFGIVWFNGDMAFTMLNVLSHGIPYMALVWAGLRRREERLPPVPPSSRGLYVKWYGLAVFLGSLFLLAYLEEGLWDGFVWQEHSTLFYIFGWLPHISNDVVLALLVPLLALPQSAHYVLDGFIWRKRYQ